MINVTRTSVKTKNLLHDKFGIQVFSIILHWRCYGVIYVALWSAILYIAIPNSMKIAVSSLCACSRVFSSVTNIFKHTHIFQTVTSFRVLICLQYCFANTYHRIVLFVYNITIFNTYQHIILFCLTIVFNVLRKFVEVGIWLYMRYILICSIVSKVGLLTVISHDFAKIFVKFRVIFFHNIIYKLNKIASFYDNLFRMHHKLSDNLVTCLQTYYPQ